MSVACCVCGGTATTMLFRSPPDHDPGGREYTIVRCDGCGTERLDPMPSEAELDEAYDTAYYDESSPDSGATGAARRMAWRTQIRPLRPFLTPGAPVLEVGCGTGSFLARIRERFGCDVFGIERSAGAADVARARGLRVQGGTLTDARLPDASVTAVIMRHVVEHVPDPRALLREVHRILSPRGAFFLTIPVTGGWDHRAFGPAWEGYEIPEHLWLFPRDALQRLLTATGFTVASLRDAYLPNPWVKGVRRALVRRGSARLSKPFTLRNPVAMVLGAPAGVAAGVSKRSGRLTVLARP
jgi:SAM-dependent methyltransferase